MKRPKFSYILQLSIASAALFALYSCASTDDGSYVAPITQYEKIGGKWLLNSVTQTDETTTNTMTLTDVLDFDTFGIDLNTDENNNPTTFEVSGNAPTILPTSGTWKLANSFVNSDGSSAQIILNDATNLTVTAVPGASKTLEFKLTRKSGGVAFVSYTYNLMSIDK